MPAHRNVFACLVHESPECIVDLVRNLRCLDPDSEVLLYDGGRSPGLLATFPWHRLGAVVHPSPRPQEWGKLHGFALDSLRYALEHLPFDTLTFVDSDQLLAAPGYSRRLGAALAGRDDVGLLGSTAGPQPANTSVGPAAAAWREIDLWRGFLRRFPGGEAAFPHWTFWPGTVITAAAARDLVRLWDRDTALAAILAASRVWATEEVVLPTLVALLGYRVEAHPASSDYVQFRQAYTAGQVHQALEREDVWSIHPIPRRYDDRLRQQVREHFDHYRSPVAPRAETVLSPPGFVATFPILQRLRPIEGWLDDEEADLLIHAAARALAADTANAAEEGDAPSAIVEVGSYCGRSTVALGSVVQAVCPPERRARRVIAIDPHRGQVGALDSGLETRPGTLDRLRENLAGHGLQSIVEVVVQCSYEVQWEGRPIRLLLIDGLHDYVNVARDFYCFEAFLVAGAYVAFHDYALYYPGVRALVDDLLASGRYRKVGQAKSLIVVELCGSPAITPVIEVSCIMPTANRRAFVPRAIAQFLAQDFVAAELIVVDDGEDRVADLMPADPRVRYLALDEKQSIGAKRNRACREARGEIILHWDDDDWMAGHRIRAQVAALRTSGAEVSGLPRLYYYDVAVGECWEYRCPRQDKLWLAGATLCYTKALWEANPFPDTSVGEDSQFLWSDHPKQVAPFDDPSLYVAFLHGANTDSRRKGDGWRRAPEDRVRRWIGIPGSREEPAPAAPATPATVIAAPDQPRPVPGRVSCLLVTGEGRRELLVRAVDCFLRQDYQNRELVIVDDGGEIAPGFLPADPRIRYFHVQGGWTAGRKRNYAAERSSGEVFVQWDDDDWSTPDRLTYQVAPLLAGEADLCGFSSELLYDTETARYWRLSPALHARMFHSDVHGRSLAFRRAVWGEAVRYPDRSLGEDAAFLAAALARGARLVRLPGGERFLYVRHALNSWRFRCGEFLDPAGWQEVPTAEVRLPLSARYT